MSNYLNGVLNISKIQNNPKYLHTRKNLKEDNTCLKVKVKCLEDDADCVFTSICGKLKK